MEKKFNLQKIGEKRYSLDARGLVCPYPQLLAMRALGGLSSGDVLEVVLDNPPSVRDIPPALREKGHEVSDAERIEKGTWKIVVQTKK
jgi:TusA-related sulfurtransferase